MSPTFCLLCKDVVHYLRCAVFVYNIPFDVSQHLEEKSNIVKLWFFQYTFLGRKDRRKFEDQSINQSINQSMCIHDKSTQSGGFSPSHVMKNKTVV